MFNPIALTADASTIGGLLDIAGDVVTWLVTQMGAYLTFITTNPIILLGAVLTLVGLGVGMLFRIWHSV